MQNRATTPHIWKIVRLFYTAEAIFNRQHDRYEELVAQYVRILGKPREEIRLEPKELSELLHFQDMEKLRDDYLEPLKQHSHALFRSDDTTTFLDRLVNDIFHEISILKEEQYNVLTYSPRAADVDTRGELDAILDEVHEMFPSKVHRMKHLFETARDRLEKILPTYKRNQVLIRSLFLYRNEFVAKAAPDGLIHLYRVIYGKDRPFEGFVEVGGSFQRSGFLENALEAHNAGLQFLRSVPPVVKRRFDNSWKEARAHFEQNIRVCEAQLAAVEEE